MSGHHAEFPRRGPASMSLVTPEEQPPGPPALVPGDTAQAGRPPTRLAVEGVELGLIDKPGDAAALRHSAHFGFRYQYLSGGANTAGWST